MQEIDEIYRLILSFAASFFIAIIFIPPIVRVSKMKNLVAEPEHRSSHIFATPNLGGFAIFAGFILSVSLWVDVSKMPYLQFVIASVIVSYFVGMKDDILIIAPSTKFFGQIIAALILVVFGDIRISNFHGFLDIYGINYLSSVLISVFVILAILNGFNFIDGVDGLSASITIITAGTFAYWFILIKEFQLALLAFSLIGSVFAFLIYNVFGRRHKIFMGDTGALIVGVVVSVLVIKFNEINLDRSKALFLYSSPAVSFAILIIPLFDLIRVIFIRLLKGNSITKPDKNHLHHQLLRLGMSHAKVSLTISCINLFFIFLAFYTAQFMSLHKQLLLILSIAVALACIIAVLVNKKAPA